MPNKQNDRTWLNAERFREQIKDADETQSFFSAITQGEQKKISHELASEIIDRLDRLERKLDLIFGSNAVINGRFVDISKM